MYDAPMTRISARAIIIMDQHVILIHRMREGAEYWVTPGGKVEEGETLEQAAKREVQEEIGIDVDVGEKIFQLTNHVYSERNEQHFFLCAYRSGDIGSGSDPRMLNSDPSDTSEIVFAERSDVETINIVPPGLKEAILGAM